MLFYQIFLAALNLLLYDREPFVSPGRGSLPCAAPELGVTIGGDHTPRHTSRLSWPRLLQQLPGGDPVGVLTRRLLSQQLLEVVQ